jgi:hypothetical protein
LLFQTDDKTDDINSSVRLLKWAFEVWDIAGYWTLLSQSFQVISMKNNHERPEQEALSRLRHKMIAETSAFLTLKLSGKPEKNEAEQPKELAKSTPYGSGKQEFWSNPYSVLAVGQIVDFLLQIFGWK